MVAVPAENVTACCFGGDDGRALFITTAAPQASSSPTPASAAHPLRCSAAPRLPLRNRRAAGAREDTAELGELRRSQAAAVREPLVGDLQRQPSRVDVDRDRVSVTDDIDARRLTLEVADEELEARLAAWELPELTELGGVFARYRLLVGSAAEGAVLRNT